MATLHNTAKEGEIAKTVILFGDPTQTHHLAHKYLDNIRKVNDIRYACYFTGEYKGKTYTFGTSGMGTGSAGTYIYELYNFYGVERIIRAGTTGAYVKPHQLKDTVIVKESYSENKIWSFCHCDNAPMEVTWASEELHNKLVESAKKLGISCPEVRAHTCDVFYFKQSFEEMQKKTGADVVEMESYVLFFYAALYKKQAACLLTVVNTLYGDKPNWLSLEEQIDIRKPSVEIILNAGLEDW